MKKNKKGRLFFIGFVIATNPIIDMFYKILSDKSIGPVSINQLLRVLLLFISFFFIKTITSKKQTLWLSLGLAFILLVQHFNVGEGSIVKDVGFALKILFGFVFLRIIYEEICSNKDFFKDINSAMVIATLIFALNIMLAPFGLGGELYENSERMKGYLGLLSGNLVAANSLLIILSYHLYMFFSSKKKLNLIFSIITFACLFLLASKFSILGALVIVLIEYFIFVGSIKTQAKKTLNFIGVMAIILSLAALIPFAVKYISKIVAQANVFDYDFFTALTSNRFMQIDIVEEYCVAQAKGNMLITRLFGTGYSWTNEVLNSVKIDFEAIELDFHGLFYYLGGGFTFVAIIYFVRMVYKGRIAYRQNDILGKFAYLTLIVLLFGATFGGHVLYETTTLVYFAIPCACVMSESRKRYVVVFADEKENAVETNVKLVENN